LSSQSPTPGPNLITLFLRAAHELTDELTERLVAGGFVEIRPAHGRVFENLDRTGTRLSDLAARAQMTHQSMSELVDGLVATGYLERQPDPADRRAKLICLTPRGRQMMRLAVREIAQLEVAWFGHLPSLKGVDGLRYALQAAIETHVASTNGHTVAGRNNTDSRTVRSPHAT
jgi:DNA-binding MarR family transcriptional regulator